MRVNEIRHTEPLKQWYIGKYSLNNVRLKQFFVFVFALRNRLEFINLRNQMISFYFRSAVICVLFLEV